MSVDGDDTKPFPRGMGAAIAISGFAVALIVGQFTEVGLAETAGGSFAAILGAGLMGRKFRARGWFWPFLIVVAFLHVLAVWFTPWLRHHQPSKGHLLIIVADMLVLLGLMALIERLTDGAGDRMSSGQSAGPDI